MRESKEQKINEFNLTEDSNNNGIPDWLEFLTTYAIVVLCFYIVLTQNPSESLIKWLITTAGILAGGRDVLKGVLK